MHPVIFLTLYKFLQNLKKEKEAEVPSFLREADAQFLSGFQC